MDLLRSTSRLFIGLIACFLFITTSHAAHDDEGDLSWLGVKFADVVVDEEGGPSGSGIGLVLDLHDNFSLALDYHSADKSQSLIVRNTANTTEVADTTEQIDVKSGSLVLNYHPLGNSFYVSGGVMYTGDIRVNTNTSLRAGSNIELGNDNLSFNSTFFDSITTELTYTDYAPYVGLGWNPFRTQSMLSPYVNVGVVFNLDPRLTIDSTGTCSAGAVGCANLEQALQEEAASRLNELEDYFWTVSAGIVLRFF